MTEIHDRHLITYSSIFQNALQEILKSIPQKEGLWTIKMGIHLSLFHNLQCSSPRPSHHLVSPGHYNGLPSSTFDLRGFSQYSRQSKPFQREDR